MTNKTNLVTLTLTPSQAQILEQVIDVSCDKLLDMLKEDDDIITTSLALDLYNLGQIQGQLDSQV